jgi:predicted O-linked N-acetylglucosamine transferase (SPINDLY family)
LADKIKALITEAQVAHRALRPERAIDILTDALSGSPHSVAGLILLGRCHADLRHYDMAIGHFDRAIALEPESAAAHLNRGMARMRIGAMPGAVADIMQATKLRPDSAPAWIALGRVFGKMALSDLALKAFHRAVTLAPEQPNLKGLLLEQKLAACDWDGLDALVTDIATEVAANRAAVSPFVWHNISSSSESLQQVARLASAAWPCESQPPRPTRVAGERLRVGYVSGELSTSANALCMAGVFEAHDRGSIELTAFDNGIDDGSALRARIVASFDHMVPVATMSDRQLATAIAECGIDVLVNLNGFFGNDRSAVFRLRPAPVQVNYLGCPGTMGAPFMDYIIADRIVIPKSEERFYDEKIVLMPDTYYPTDRNRPISPRVFSRQECGLPTDGFVFCCFNVSHKILPESFARWMRILARVPDSVLWLIDSNASAKANLRAQATAQGIDPDRLVFAPSVPPPDHLARHGCADLFLDTLPYNAHTTAVDALLSGLPVLTCRGSAFPGRVAASLLAAIGLDELVTTTADEYERRAVELASEPQALARVRTQLATNRMSMPLFDTTSYTRHLERAYRTMFDRHCDGLPTANFSVSRV